jgi:hypothetical protein
VRIFHELLVDEYVPDTNLRFVKAPWQAVMGNFESLRLFAVADRVSGTTPTLFAGLFETPDLTYNRAFAITLLNSVALVTGQMNALSGAVTASDLCMAYGYDLCYSLGGTSPNAHVRIWVTGRGKV